MSDEFVDEFPQAATYRVPRRSFVDSGTKRLALIAGGLGASLCAVVGVWSFSNHHGGRIPVIEADSRPLRVKPDNPGGMQLAGANDEILSGDGAPENGKLAAAPESPDPEALRAPRPSAAAVVPPVAAPASVVTAAPAVTSPNVAKTTTAAAATAAKTAVPGHQPATATAIPPASKTRAGVQLAALESEGDAKAEWERLNRKMPDLLKGHHPAVIKAEHDGRTFWRLRTGGFDDEAQATAFCERVRSKGAGCSITSF